MTAERKKNYVIGVDFGTLSARAALVCLEDGTEVSSSAMDYPHGVMTDVLPCGNVAAEPAPRLKPGSAIQDPRDYMEALEGTVRDVMNRSGVDPADVLGIAVDSTASSVLPVTEDGTPLCALDRWNNEPHAYLKLWKHHAAQDQATRIETAAKCVIEAERRSDDQAFDWLARYGNQVSAEWALPKILEVLEDNEELYCSAAYFVEAGDWIVWNLTGRKVRSSCMMGYKYFWTGIDGEDSGGGQGGYPSRDFFEAVDPRLSDFVETKLAGTILPTGSFAGTLTKEAAGLLGLAEGTAVATAIIDAHAALPALGLVGPGKMLMIMGTSTCHIIMDEKEHIVPGISGVVKDGIVPGLYAYEAGQSAVGDMFGWFVDNCVPKTYHDAVATRGITLHAFMEELAAALPPGGAGVVALDWWNGNRSILSNTDLLGAMFGLTLQTKPEEIYRALLEATAYGARVIMDAYRSHGVEIREVYASGGIPGKNPLIMQIYADVLNCPVSAAKNPPSAGLGSAIFAAAASGYYGTVEEAAGRMARQAMVVYTPDPERAKRYDVLFGVYKELHDYFGVQRPDLMKTLKE
ncbi:MAG: ribulokinase [Firmicutes bacterium]|nr:ribulokinase [Bacillota bacterium]